MGSPSCPYINFLCKVCWGEAQGAKACQVAGLVVVVVGKGNIFEDNRLPYGYIFGQMNLDALRYFFPKVPEDTCLIIGVRTSFLTPDVKKNLAQAVRKLVLCSF